MNFLGPYKYVLDAIVLLALVAAVAFGVHKYNTYQQDIGAARVQELWDKQLAADKEVQRTREIQLTKERDDALAQAAKSRQTIAAAVDSAAITGRVLHDTQLIPVIELQYGRCPNRRR